METKKFYLFWNIHSSNICEEDGQKLKISKKPPKINEYKKS